jgi:ABC-2 type transport system ATP-binding protein
VADGPVASLLDGDGTTVRATDPASLAADLSKAGLPVDLTSDGALVVAGAEPSQVFAVAAAGGHVLTELRANERGLEDLFFQLTTAA